MCKFLKVIVKIVIAYFLFGLLGIFGVHQFFIGDAGKGQEYLESGGIYFVVTLINIVCSIPFLLVDQVLGEIVYAIIFFLSTPVAYLPLTSLLSLVFVDFFTLAFQVIAIEYK